MPSNARPRIQRKVAKTQDVFVVVSGLWPDSFSRGSRREPAQTSGQRLLPDRMTGFTGYPQPQIFVDAQADVR